jgi:hypothetical protein
MPPVNDNFADRLTLIGDAGTWSGSSDGATHEAGEPSAYAGTGGNSIWFEWTPGYTGTATLDTAGSTYTGTADILDTVIDVFTGSALPSLVFVAGDDDSGPGVNSAVAFPVTAGSTYIIRVDGYSGDTGDVVLHWHPPAPPPTITSFTPSTAAAGDTVTITGTHFLDADQVAFRYGSNSFASEWINASFVVDSDTQITAVVPVDACTGPILVTGPAPTYVDVISGTPFTIPGSLGIAGVSPNSGGIGTEITVTGTGFLNLINQAYLTDITTVSYGENLPTVDSDTQCRVDVNSSTGPGLFRVRLLDSFGHNVFSAATLTFTAIVPAVIASFAPAVGPAGTVVTVTGTGFTGATAVTLGGRPALFTVLNDTTLTLTVPAGVSAGRIAVTTVSGTSSSSGAFIVGRPAPPPLRGYTRKSVADNASATIPFDVPAGTRPGDILLFVAVQHTPAPTGVPSLDVSKWNFDFDQFSFTEDSGGYMWLGSSARIRTAHDEDGTYVLYDCAVGAGVDIEIVCLAYSGTAGWDRGDVVHTTGFSPLPTVATVGVEANFPDERYVAAAAAPGQDGGIIPPFGGQRAVVQIATPTISLTVSDEHLLAAGLYATNLRTTPLPIPSSSIAAAWTIKPGSVLAVASVGRVRLWKDRG